MAAAGEEDSTLPFVPQFIDWQDPGKINSIFHDGSSSGWWSRIIIYRFSPRHRGIAAADRALENPLQYSASLICILHPWNYWFSYIRKSFTFKRKNYSPMLWSNYHTNGLFLLLFLKGSLSSGHERQKGSLQIIGLKTTHFPFKVDGPLLLLEESSCTNANVLKVWQNIMA